MADIVPKVRTCGTPEVHERLLATDATYRQNRATLTEYIATRMRHYADAGVTRKLITIPVVVHVVYNDPKQKVGAAQVRSQITALNKDYRKKNPDVCQVNSDKPGTTHAFQDLAADMGLQFKLAVRDPEGKRTNGVTYTKTNVQSFGTDDKVKFSARGGYDIWPRDSYLNLWVCPLDGNGLLGYAQFPGGPAATDGVVINYLAFGTNGTAKDPFNKGRTATHEIGHWLDLHHLWADGSDNRNCDQSDLVDDTPPQQGPNYKCPKYPHVTCNNNPTGDMFINYMDYVNDACMNMFTAGQLQRVDALFIGPTAPRAALIRSDALTPVK
ncbi:MAG: zinc metalloprotease [Halobacteriota archaeon]